MPLWTHFNLSEFMFSHFNRVDFGGDLFGQWPVGIRFEIGISQVYRASRLYELAFAKAANCILVSQEWMEGTEIARRATPLFSTQGIFPTKLSELQTVDISPFDEAEYRLTWTRFQPFTFDAVCMFQSIANREQAGSPAISGKVYVIDPSNCVIMHMYDDRGLDIIATELDTLRPLFETFNEWVLDNQRHRVDFRFRSNPQTLTD
jgi:hypothetical protein